MKILVSGGAGFIGRNFIEEALRRGFRVVCIDNFYLGSRQNIEALLAEKAFVFYEADAADRKAVAAIFERERPEYVFHLAANSDIQASSKNPAVEYQNTYGTTFSLLENMRKYGVRRFFFASTSAVYGDKRGVALREDTPELSPVSYYGAMKLGGEGLVSAFTHMNHMSSLIFRFPNVIGPHLTHGVVYDFIRKLSSEPDHLEILGDGCQTKPYIYIEDLIRAIFMFMDCPEGVELYNVGVDSATSVTKIADIVCKEMKLENVKYHYTGGESGWLGDVPRFEYCLDKIHKAGWRARYTSDEAVRETVRRVLSCRR